MCVGRDGNCTCNSMYSCVLYHIKQYSSEKNNLQALVRKYEIREEIEDRRCASAGVLRDYCDAEFVRNHPLVKNNETLLLAFYFDDLETANPLGSRRGNTNLVSYSVTS